MEKSILINNRMQKIILSGSKTPHSTSQPVIFCEHGHYYLAVFSFLYNKEDIQSGMVNRPTMWAVANIKTGEVIQEYETREREFSDAPYGIKYNIRSNAKYDTSLEYYDKTFTILDSVRRKLINEQKLYDLEYRVYLNRILANIPEGYKRFYTDLSI